MDGEMARCLRALVAPAACLSSVSSMHIAAHNQFQGIQCPHAASVGTSHKWYTTIPEGKYTYT